MLHPPFKFATASAVTFGPGAGGGALQGAACCEAHEPAARPVAATRPRLADLDPHLHCSVIGTCLSTAELRKLMARFLFVRDSSDLEVHHEAVGLASHDGRVAKALHKALDQRHEAALQRFARVHGAAALAALWEEALRQGEVPGAYWAVLTHRDTTPTLRQKVFGDVHMLSHLVGAANRADIRRLMALERDNAELKERLERHQHRSQDLLEERDRALLQLRQELAEERVRAMSPVPHAPAPHWPVGSGAASLVALQTERRERAEQAADVATGEATRLREELEHMARHTRALSLELAAAETQLREACDENAAPDRGLDTHLQGRRILYVGGRPSSTPAIRDLVLRHGGEFQRHDGGLEDRKGLLAAAVAWATLVVFPVDCIDHDSATNLKRLCQRQQVGFLPLRSAGVASFAAGVAQASAEAGEPERPGPAACLKHG